MEQPIFSTADKFRHYEHEITPALRKMMNIIEEHGFVGNIWIRQNWLLKKGDTGGGHLHYHDHVSLLVKGSVEVQVENEPPKTFQAPTFIVVKKQYSHRFTALEDDTVYYCLFALQDIDGNMNDVFQEDNLPNLPSQNEPHFASAAPPDYWEKITRSGL
jgi:quercetin dioxygenase-like cupin family protein